MFLRVDVFSALLLSSLSSELAFSVKNVEKSSQFRSDLANKLEDLASLFDCSLSRSKSFLGLFFALSSSCLKNSFFDLRMFLL